VNPQNIRKEKKREAFSSPPLSPCKNQTGSPPSNSPIPFIYHEIPPSPSFFSFLFLSWLSLFPNTNLHSLTFLTSSQTQLHRQTTLFKKKIKKRTTLVFGFSLKNYYIKTCHNQRNPPLEEIWTSAH
jgi:hypothetical protein